MPELSSRRQLVEHVYHAQTGRHLPDDIDAFRDADCSWDEVAVKVLAASDVRVSRVTLAAWYGDPRAA